MGAMRDLSNQMIKGYHLREMLGEGGFGAVYKASQPSVGRDVAIKFILPGLANQPDFIRRFESEAQLIARLEHPHITPLYDYWRDPDGAYLVMRWLRGGSLADLLKPGALDVETIARILEQVAGALSLAHRNGVIHRDIKPGNILMDEDGNAYLADFGIAKDLKQGDASGTQMDAIVGSLDYISPEQARSEPVTPRTDIYSLGVVLYEMLVGEHPFPKITSVERLYKHINDPLPEITRLDDAICDAVNQVVQQATAKNPTQRYESANEFAAAFKEAAGLNRAASNSTLVELLTRREQEVLSLLVAGLSNKEIAQKLVVTVPTVKWYINELFRKLRVRSRVQAIVRARDLNLIVKPGEITDSVAIPTEDFHPENPYKGLRAFQSADNQDFFGREKVTAKLVKRLGETGDYCRFLAVVGPSGSGKSSLVKAGLIPALWRGDLPGSEKWFVIEMLPGSHPLDELEIALTRINTQQSANLNEHLRRDARGLVRVASLILPNDNSELVLVIDQFEEVYTLLEDDAARQHFLNLLYAAVMEPRSRIRIVITLRADFYDRPLHYPQFGELVRTRLETIMPLSAAELERAISKPAEQVGVTFEPGLVAAIIGDVNYQPGALPLLQYALTELFEQRKGRLLTREAYQTIGGTVGALAKRAEEVFVNLDDEAQAITRQIFLRLVTLGEGTEDTRRRTARSELQAVAVPNPTPNPSPLHGEGDSQMDLVEEIIDTFANYRLLSLDTDPGTRTPTVEVAHEALLREWERLRSWLNDSREDIKIQRQLSAMAHEWHTAKQDTSFLARGLRLNLFEKWITESQLSLTPQERAFLEKSLAQRDLDAQAELERQAREKNLEKRSQNFLRGLVAVFAVATVIAIGLSAVAFTERNRAEEALVVAQTNAHEAQQVALIAGSQAVMTGANDTDLAIALSLEAVKRAPESANAQAALSEAAYAPGTMRVFEGHTDYVNGGTFSPDGTQVLSASWDKTVRLWDITTGAELRVFEGHTDRVTFAEFLPDGQSAISSSRDGTLIRWDIQAGDMLKQFENAGSELWTMAVSPNGQSAAAAGLDSTIWLWDSATGEIIRQFEGHAGSIETLIFNAAGTQLLSTSHDTTIILWDVENGTPIRTFEGHRSMVTSAVFSPDNTQIASSSLDGTLRLWDIETGELLDTFIEDRDIWGVIFSQDAHQLISAGIGGGIARWNIETGQFVDESLGHIGTINGIVLHPDGRWAITSSADATLRLWDLENGQMIYRLKSEGYWWNYAELSPDGTHLSIIWRTPPYSDVLFINTATGEELYRYHAEEIIEKLAFSPDGQTLALVTYGEDNPSFIILLDVNTGQERHRFEASDTGLLVVEFSPDGQYLVSGARGGALVLWDMNTYQEVRRFIGYESSDTGTNFWTSAAFTPDGQRLITPHFNGVIAEWDVATGAEIRQLEGHEAWAYNFVLSDDGQLGYSGAEDRAAILWDIPNGVPLQRFMNSLPVAGVNITGDGRYGLEGIVAQLRDLETGEVIRRYNGALALLSWFTPDNRTAVVGPPANAPELWRMDTTLDELITWIRANRYIPELTCEQRELYRLEPLCEAETP
jgi:WD40 repeat protein/serine/threonine protein kinase